LSQKLQFPLVYRGHGFSDLPKHPYHQKLCRIVCRGRGRGPHNVALLFEDGHVLVTRRADRSTRRARTKDRQLTLL
jgi:hypothetical protein